MIWVAPLFIFTDGQWNAVVEHGGQNIHERHLRHHRVIQLRRLIDHRAHQQAAGAAPHGIDTPRLAVTLFD
ncbi:hypothetical protein D3C72_1753000 [compost metagenome]